MLQTTSYQGLFLHLYPSSQHPTFLVTTGFSGPPLGGTTKSSVISDILNDMIDDEFIFIGAAVGFVPGFVVAFYCPHMFVFSQRLHPYVYHICWYTSIYVYRWMIVAIQTNLTGSTMTSLLARLLVGSLWDLWWRSTSRIFSSSIDGSIHMSTAFVDVHFLSP